MKNTNECQEIFSIVEEMHRIKHSSAKRELPGKFRVVHALAHNVGPMSMSDIAKTLNISVPRVNTIVNSLLKSKMVIKTTSAKDKRITLIQLSKSGSTEMGGHRKMMEKKANQMLSVLDQQDINDLSRILKKILIKMKEENV